MDDSKRRTVKRTSSSASSSPKPRACAPTHPTASHQANRPFDPGVASFEEAHVAPIVSHVGANV